VSLAFVPPLGDYPAMGRLLPLSKHWTARRQSL